MSSCQLVLSLGPPGTGDHEGHPHVHHEPDAAGVHSEHTLYRVPPIPPIFSLEKMRGDVHR